MSTPPNKLKAKLSALAAGRDATDIGIAAPQAKQPVDEYELRYGGNRDTKRPPIHDYQLDDDLAQAEINLKNKKLTGTSNRKGK